MCSSLCPKSFLAAAEAKLKSLFEPLVTEKKRSISLPSPLTLPPSDMDSTMCRGKDSDGTQCICIRCMETHEVEGKLVCKSCGHIESAHPALKSSVGNFIRNFRDAGKLSGSSSGSSSSVGNSSKGSVSIEEAEAETNAGLRKKRSSKTDTEPPPAKKQRSSKEKGKTRAVQKEGEHVQYGKLVFLPEGLLNGDLRSTKAIEFLERQPYHGDPNDPPEVQKQTWLGVYKDGRELALAGDPLPTGVELADHCKQKGTSKADRVLFLASKIKIPEKRYQDWDASDTEPESEDLGSDIDTMPSEDIVMTPRKPAKKLKIKEEIGNNPMYANLSVKTEPEDESDMRRAAKMRTRISSGVLKPKPLFIPGTSEGPEPEPGAGPSQNSEEDVVVVSSDDDDFPPPAPTLAGTPPLSVIANAWKSPLRILNPKSPTPAPSPAPESPPNVDPPLFFDDFAAPDDYMGMMFSSGAIPSGGATPSAIASSSTPSFNTSSTSDYTAPSTPEWAQTPACFSSFGNPSWSTAPPNPAPHLSSAGPSSNPSSSSTAAHSMTSESTGSTGHTSVSHRPRFRSMVKGRADRDPWSGKR
ncbi:hypothetical protein B0H17DRAFT_1263426 [Mycena rosella]|uniref:Uncharacterized protein n=1 Tax=Mycena rosella TaxID=1033263 RepID=A0AAD7G1S9_MYCRO|nr:hypothetical protein B0H17DRAFT_1263426 [Mycena rosella]